MKYSVRGKIYLLKTKNGNEIQRPNKVAIHYSLKSKIKDGDLLTLAVRGTLDKLGSRNGINSISKKSRIEHNIHKGYFKEVYIISDYGKRLLKNHLRNEKIN